MTPPCQRPQMYDSHGNMQSNKVYALMKRARSLGHAGHAARVDSEEGYKQHCVAI